MADSNVFVTVTDPDRLLAGTSPYASFAAKYIQVYRYSSEGNARADSSGTLLDAGSGYTWTLIASTQENTAEAGPYRFGYYDSGQSASSWYRYRFANSALDTFSPLSEPWEADNRPQVTLRDILFEAGDLLGGSVLKGTAATNASANKVDCAALFKSSVRDARFYENWWLLCSQDAGGAAPEGEHALIASVDTTAGIATLDRELSAAVTNGDTVLLSALIEPDEMVRIVNRVREKMLFLATVDIALATTVDKYPAPWGVKSETDVIEALGVIQYSNSNREDEYPIDWRLEFDGYRGWLYFPYGPGLTPVARVRLLRSYRDLEGKLTAMGDTTSAPMEWLRPAVAYAMAEWLAKSDPQEPEYQQLKGDLESDARAAAARFAPEVVRPAKRGHGRRMVPGPVQVS